MFTEPIIRNAERLNENNPTPSSNELAEPTDLFGGSPWSLRTISGRKSFGSLVVKSAGTFEGGGTRYEDLYGTAPPIIGIDAEWDGRYEPHKVLSYQFAVIHGGRAWRGIIYTDGDRRKFGEIIGEVLEIGVRNKYLTKWPKEVFLAAHLSKAELSHMADFSDIKNQFDAAQKTFVSTRAPYGFKYWDRNRNKHSVKTWLYDTGVLAPAGKSVDALGELYDFKKIKLHEDSVIEGELKGCMEDVLMTRGGIQLRGPDAVVNEKLITLFDCLLTLGSSPLAISAFHCRAILRA